MNPARSFLTLLLLMSSIQSTQALELFGVELESTSADELRAAAKEAGMVLVREGGEENWFDVYDSSTVLPGSSRLYLGFVKQDQRFAFAEYEFNGLRPERLLRDLVRKYGATETRKGRFVTDSSYHWQRGGISIDLVSDWQNYKTRLSYIHPANLADLLAEQRTNTPAETAAEVQVSIY